MNGSKRHLCRNEKKIEAREQDSSHPGIQIIALDVRGDASEDWTLGSRIVPLPG
jgi:hypothetical protein